MPETPTYAWAVLAVVIAVALAADIAIFHREHNEKREPTLKIALAESACWIGLALAFNAWIYFTRGPEAGTQFLTGYLVEKTLSADNILIFLVIFQTFGVAASRQHRVLYYGVFGALVLRGAFVFAGIALLQRIHAVLYAFGAILLIASVQMLSARKRKQKPEQNWLVRLARRAIPVAQGYEGDAFFTRQGERWNATYLLLALLAVEAMDIVFAVDSVPAVLAITRDAFIVYSSNAFAILGLRALYFALAGVLPKLRYFHQGLAAILAFMGIKMILSERLRIPDWASLTAIAAILAVTIGASMMRPAVRAEQRAR